MPSRRDVLTWDLFLAPSIPAITSDVPPGETERPWPPIWSTLISGERDAVLVDTPVTVEQARALVNWLVARGKNLTTIYATHGHGDHFFGTSTVLERLPGARFVARPEVIEVKTLSRRLWLNVHIAATRRNGVTDSMWVRCGTEQFSMPLHTLVVFCAEVCGREEFAALAKK
jgi:glyoxylase-like metal-dependent hydrolase (beta-lactamase superfamily II)